MKNFHGSEAFYRDFYFSKEESTKCLRAHEIYIRNAINVFGKITDAFPCLCGDIKLPDDSTEKQVASILHDILADHCPMAQCKKCKLLMRREILEYHEFCKCDDKLASARQI